MRKLLALMAALLITISGVQPALAQGLDPLLVPVAADEAQFFLSEDDHVQQWGSYVKLQPPAPDENLERQQWIDCNGIADPQCATPPSRGYTKVVQAVLPSCESATSEDCIVSFGLELDGQFYPGEYVSAVNVDGSTDALPSQNLFRGGQSSIFRVAEVPHDQGDLYMVSPQAGLLSDFRTPFVTNDFYLMVIPVVINPRSFEASLPDRLPCIWRNATECATRAKFNIESKVSVQIRLTSEVGGWFLGRMKDPVIDVTSFSPRNNLLTLTAHPVEVARFSYTVKKEDVTLADRRAAGNSGGIGGWEDGGSIRIFNNGFDTSNFGMLRHFKQRVNDTAVGTSTIFQMRTTSRDSGNPCLGDRSRVLGIVTTNSMVYDGFTPRFSRGFLDYRVAGLHYEPDGVTEVLGSYDLVMRSDVARCLYGFSNAPVSATVTITGEGDSNIATTIVSERNGWLKLAAYGFTFSQKTIKVQLTQPLTRTLNKFAGRTTTLSATQRSQIRTLVTNSKSAKTITCTANFVKAADRATALRRAQNACAHARSVNRNFKFTSVARQVKNTNQDRTVIVRSS
jgi:hypothetical protein